MENKLSSLSPVLSDDKERKRDNSNHLRQLVLDVYSVAGVRGVASQDLWNEAANKGMRKPEKRCNWLHLLH